ncbi:hypothetical protein PV773_01700 [Mesorhizobium sp. CC13]|uniref:hypothetical protein n=1 Tax=Mesorhizobium sp. CC13 TaxID=3029194 RepID=UPI0032654D1D
MKTASALLQILALSALFAMHVAAPAEYRMPGVRRALETIAISSKVALAWTVEDIASGLAS